MTTWAKEGFTNEKPAQWRALCNGRGSFSWGWLRGKDGELICTMHQSI